MRCPGEARRLPAHRARPCVTACRHALPRASGVVEETRGALPRSRRWVRQADDDGAGVSRCGGDVVVNRERQSSISSGERDVSCREWRQRLDRRRPAGGHGGEGDVGQLLFSIRPVEHPPLYSSPAAQGTVS